MGLFRRRNKGMIADSIYDLRLQFKDLHSKITQLFKDNERMLSDIYSYFRKLERKVGK